MYKVKNMLNAHEFPRIGEINTMPSLTKPDQTLTIREILDRYANGMPLMGHRVPVFDEGNDLPDPRTLDYTELQEMAESFEKEIRDIRTKADAIKAKNEALLRQQREEDELMRKKFREQAAQKPDKDNPVVQKPA